MYILAKIVIEPNFILSPNSLYFYYKPYRSNSLYYKAISFYLLKQTALACSTKYFYDGEENLRKNKINRQVEDYDWRSDLPYILGSGRMNDYSY